MLAHGGDVVEPDAGASGRFRGVAGGPAAPRHRGDPAQAALGDCRARRRGDDPHSLAPEAVGHHEVYELVFAPGAALVSDPHRPGCREHLAVIEGALRVESGEAARRLRGIRRYAADRAHAIRGCGAVARAILIVQDS